MRFLKSEAGAIILWLVASLIAAALLMPWLYEAGKNLAENHPGDGLLGILQSIRNAQPDRFFSRALLISALALLPALIWRVRIIPKKEDAGRYQLRELTWLQRLLHLTSGLLLGTFILGGVALILHLTGASQSRDVTFSFGKIFSKAFMPALGAGIIEELVFRGLLLGLWLRACSRWTAWIGSSLMFSFLHFLKPPRGLEITDPAAWDSGFQILSSTLGHFTNPAFFVTEFATLALLGLILAYCRTRTFSLWLPIGLHAGLVFALKFFSMTQNLNPTSPLHPWLIGNDLKSGLLPLLGLGICFFFCTIIVRKLMTGKFSVLR